MRRKKAGIEKSGASERLVCAAMPFKLQKEEKKTRIIPTGLVENIPYPIDGV